MALVRRSPFDELMSLPRVMDRMFDESFLRPGRWFFREVQAPALDMHTTGPEIVIEAALPGLKVEDVEISLDRDSLTLSGSLKTEESREEAGYAYRELARGAFTRTVPLPVPVNPDLAKAVFRDGMLTLTLPKAEEAKPHRLQIRAG
jgi:HSP20 family protein